MAVLSRGRQFADEVISFARAGGPLGTSTPSFGLVLVGSMKPVQHFKMQVIVLQRLTGDFSLLGSLSKCL